MEDDKNILIHKVNGDYIGAYVFKNKDNTQTSEVQPVTLHKDNIDKFYHKLITQLPANYKGKLPIGRISKEYSKTRDVLPLNTGNNQMQQTSVEDRIEKLIDALYEAEEPKQKLSSKTIPSDIKIPEHITPEDLVDLENNLKNSDYINQIEPILSNHIEKVQNKYQTNREGLNKLVNVVAQANKEWGPDWAKRLHHELTKPKQKLKSSTSVPKINSGPKGEIQSTETPKKKAKSNLLKITYSGTNGDHVLDTKYLSKALPLTINKNLDTLPDTDPKLVKELYDNLGEHWQQVLNLARKAKSSADLKQSPYTWLQTLSSDPSVMQSSFVQLPNFGQIAAGIFDAAKNAEIVKSNEVLPPDDSSKTAHYHTKDNVHKFDPTDVRNALIKLDNTSPLSIIHKDSGLADVLKYKFGPNYGLLLTMAQRLARYKATNNPDPVGQLRNDFKYALDRSFGSDWENNFNQIVNSLDDKATITQADPSLEKKEKAQNVQVTYQNKDQIGSPDLHYLKMVALPSLVDKSLGYIETLETEDSNLANELKEKLGPSWKILVSISKMANKAVAKEDPYVNILNYMKQNPEFESNLEKTLGPSYLDVTNKVVEAITGVKPPRDLQQMVNQPGVAAQPEQLPQQPAQQADPNQVATAGAQPQPPQPAPAPDQAQIDPNAQDQAGEQNPALQPSDNPAVVSPETAQQLNEPMGEPSAMPDKNPAQTTGNSFIQGDGSVPQSKNNNLEIDKENDQDQSKNIPLSVKLPEPQPTASGIIKRFDTKGNLHRLKSDSILQAVDLDFEENSKEAKDALYPILGIDYWPLYEFIQMGQHLIDKGVDPEKHWETQNANARIAKGRSDKLGGDYALVIKGIANVLKQYNLAKQQAIEAQKQEILALQQAQAQQQQVGLNQPTIAQPAPNMPQTPQA